MTWIIDHLEEFPHGPWTEVRKDDALGLWKLLHNSEVGQKDQLMSSTGETIIGVHLYVKEVFSILPK